MAYVLKISSVLKETDPTHARLITIILEKMNQFSKSGFRHTDGKLKSYQDYAPHLDFGMQYTRTMIGNALGELWGYCRDEDIPWLNLLVVRKDTQLPGDGVSDWYIGKFGTLTGFETFCQNSNLTAEAMLLNGCISIVP
jgi:hypothetical protein